MNPSIEALSTDQDLEFFIDMEFEANLELQPEKAKLPKEEQFAAHRKELLDYIESKPQTKIFIAHHQQVPIGLVWVSVRDRNDSWDFEPLPAWIYDIRVLPEYRQQGLGKKLLGQAESWAKAEKLTRIGLHVYANNLAAQQLYRNAEFAISSYYLQKKLTPATCLSLSNSEYQFRAAEDDADFKSVFTLDYERFHETANRTISVPQETTGEKYQKFWEAAKIKDDFVCLAENAGNTFSGFAWAYPSRGDLGDQRYVWMQSLQTLAENDSLLENLLAQVEQWAFKQGLEIIRTGAQTTNPYLPAMMQANNYVKSNIFMHKRLSTA